MKMACSIQGSIASAAGIQMEKFEEVLFSDEMFFEVHPDEKDRRASLIENKIQSRRDSLSMDPKF